MRWGSWVVVLAASCSGGDSGEDGSSCATAGDCRSGQCFGQICIDSTCSEPGQPAGQGGCGSAFACLHSDGSPLLGLPGGNYCQLVCGPGASCPAEFTCDASSFCDFTGPTLAISFTPMQPHANETVHLTVALTPDAPLMDTSWTFFDGTPDQQGTEVDHQFPAGTTEVSVFAENAEATAYGSNVFVTAD